MAQSSTLIHLDDGELIDMEGNPVSAVVVPPPPPVPEGPTPEAFWRCDGNTIQRNMDGWEAFRLMMLLIGGGGAEICDADYRALPADVKRHMRRSS